MSPESARPVPHRPTGPSRPGSSAGTARPRVWRSIPGARTGTVGTPSAIPSPAHRNRRLGWLTALSTLLAGCGADLPSQVGTNLPLAQQWQPGQMVIDGAGALLTPEERDVVAHINMVRANPSAYARFFLLPRRPLFEQTIYHDPFDPRRRGLRTAEGAPAVDEAAAELHETAPMPPLAVSAALTRAARQHAAEQSATGATGHTGRTGSTPSSRVSGHGSWQWVVGEAAAYGPTSGREIVGRLLIDDGFVSRGHRRAILDPRFGVVGVAIAPHPRYGRAIVIDFADAVEETPP